MKKNKVRILIVGGTGFIGYHLAKRAIKLNINKIYFDRGCYKYHGRIKLLTEALRKHGLEF